MTIPSGNKYHLNRGGTPAMRGFYVQTLAALLDALDAAPHFTEITLEPVSTHDQFDFSWRDAKDAKFVVQVKSSINNFSRSQVSGFAKTLKQAASGSQHCTLILFGNCDASLNQVSSIDGVAIVKRSLEINGLIDGAAHRMACFMEANRLNAGPAAEREQIIDALIGALFKQTISRQPMQRAAFIALLKRLLHAAPGYAPPNDIERVTRYARRHLIGRDDDLARLTRAWDQALQDQAARPHILSLVALGGEGKTALLAHWATQLAQDGWRGCDAAFGWSFYSQGTEQQVAASSELFIQQALLFFGEAELAASNQSGVEKARRLAHVIAARRVLLLLDGVEPLQYAPTSPMRGELKDQALAQLLRTLALGNRGLCVLTTRYAMTDLQGCWDTSAPQHAVRRLSQAAGVTLLRRLGVKGAQSACEQLVESVQGHALCLNLFGAYLRDAHHGDIKQCGRVRLAEADAKERGGHAFRVMDAYAAWLAGDGEAGQRALALLSLLGLFERPASANCINALLQAPSIGGLTDAFQAQDESALNLCVTRLQDAHLLTQHRASDGAITLDAHPLLREYFAQRLQTSNPAAWQAGHSRLYWHLTEHTKDKAQPTLEDLQPLYQAVAHGCLAGMQQQVCDEVYAARIVLRNEFYSTRKLGAFGADLGAVACFFVQPWRRVSPALREADQARLLGDAAFCLRALGRLPEAEEPLRASLAMHVKQEHWQRAAAAAGNLSELALTRGYLATAIAEADQAVRFADSSGDAYGDVYERMSKRTAHADALHQAGQPMAARALFVEAEAIQAELQPSYRLLYSLQGFRYCELLLAAPEAAAWRCSVQRVAADNGAQHLSVCDAVTERTAQTLKIVKDKNWLLAIALDHLTLGRAALFAAILQASAPTRCESAFQHAVDGLRRGGIADFLPRGLLTRAWLRAVSRTHSGPDSAQTDLDEAWDIAVRGPMPLLMAEIHLTRAGLFHHLPHYPWHSPQSDATEARRLITEQGYLRRLAALEVVEQALGMQS